MDCLSESLCNTQTGCNVGGVMINHLMYADDLVILSPSVKGLQRLLDICDVYGHNHDILFNHDKTVCMYIPSGSCYYLNTPVLFLMGFSWHLYAPIHIWALATMLTMLTCVGKEVYAMLVPMAL